MHPRGQSSRVFSQSNPRLAGNVPILSTRKFVSLLVSAKEQRCQPLTPSVKALSVVPLCPGYAGPTPPMIRSTNAKNKLAKVMFSKILLLESGLPRLENRGDPPGVKVSPKSPDPKVLPSRPSALLVRSGEVSVQSRGSAAGDTSLPGKCGSLISRTLGIQFDRNGPISWRCC